MLSNPPKLNFSYLAGIQILYPSYHPKIIEHILKQKQKSKRVFIQEITRNLMKMKIKTKNRSHRYDKNRSRFRHGHKYSK